MISASASFNDVSQRWKLEASFISFTYPPKTLSALPSDSPHPSFCRGKVRLEIWAESPQARVEAC